jgi:uncharacterized protein (DUF697 family)
MFENIGSKIKSIAKGAFIVEALGAVIAGVGAAIDQEEIVYILVAVGGVAAAWILACFAYGFGQLIENSDIIAEEYSRKNEAHHKAEVKTEARKQAQNRKAVKAAIANPEVEGTEFVDVICPSCNTQLSFMKEQLQDPEGLICPICDAIFQV